MKNLETDRHEKRLEWVSGGRYAVAVEVDAIYPVDDPSEPCFTPETVKHLEKLQSLAEAGDVDSLKNAGRVYVLLSESA